MTKSAHKASFWCLTSQSSRQVNLQLTQYTFLERLTNSQLADFNWLTVNHQPFGGLFDKWWKNFLYDFVKFAFTVILMKIIPQSNTFEALDEKNLPRRQTGFCSRCQQ